MKLAQVFNQLELHVGSWMENHGVLALRIAMGIVFFWFGVLKPLGLSPAADMIAKTTFWIPIPRFLDVLGVWEMLIGLCFIYKPLIRVALVLLFLHMPGTMLPLIILPEACYVSFPFALTLEGQYIIKNLVLISAAIVIGGKVRYRMQGLARFAPEEFTTLLHRGTWANARAGEKLATQDAELDRVSWIQSGRVSIQVNGKEVAQSGSGNFIGEMSFLADSKATATVEVVEDIRYIYWPHSLLKELTEQEPELYRAMMATLNLDLITKLQDRRHA